MKKKILIVEDDTRIAMMLIIQPEAANDETCSLAMPFRP